MNDTRPHGEMNSETHIAIIADDLCRRWRRENPAFLTGNHHLRAVGSHTALANILSLAVVVTMLVGGSASAGRFIPLGDLPGGEFRSEASAVSADGTVVVGAGARRDGWEAFRWTQTGGMVGLGDLPGGGFFSQAFGVSADGAVVVGSGRVAGDPFDEDMAFRWTASAGMRALGSLPGDSAYTFASRASAASADGSVIVGWADIVTPPDIRPRVRGFRYTNGTGMVGLQDLPNGTIPGTARDVSADGRVIVGGSDGNVEAFRWTPEDGTVGLGDLPGGLENGVAFAVSADGSTVVGQNHSSDGVEAFIWTEGTGMVGIGDLPGGSVFARARGVSADGALVVGTSSSHRGEDAFVWDAKLGMRSLWDILTDLGDDLTGWRALQANGISADGRFVVGEAFNPNGDKEAFLADISGITVPEPATAILAATFFGLSILVLPHRCRWRARCKAMTATHDA